MSKRNIIMLVLALLIAGITAFAMSSRMEEPPPVVEQKPDNLVLVAKGAIPMGGFVRSMEHLEWKEWPKEAIQDGVHIREGTEPLGSFEGAVARRGYRPGEAITAGTLIKPGSGGFLSAVLNPGMRAVSIAVNATSGNAGFIFPGDYVDVILVNRVRTRNPITGDEQEYIFSNTFVEKSRVLAVDQQLDNPENKAILAKTVTVEVTSKQAEKIQIATEMGKVSFALRSITDNTAGQDADKEVVLNRDGEKDISEMADQDYITAIESQQQDASFTSDAEVSPALGTGGANSSVQVIRGDKSESQSFYRNTQ